MKQLEVSEFIWTELTIPFHNIIIIIKDANKETEDEVEDEEENNYSINKQNNKEIGETSPFDIRVIRQNCLFNLSKVFIFKWFF